MLKGSRLSAFIRFRLCLEVCTDTPPSKETRTATSGQTPAPINLQPKAKANNCILQARFSIGINNCLSPKGHNILLWDWEPAGQNINQFKVWLEVKRPNRPVSKTAIKTIEVSSERSDGDGYLGSLVPDLEGNLVCGAEAKVYVEAIDAEGESGISESIPVASGPPCQAEVTVTFETLKAWDIKDGFAGWFGLGWNDVLETTGSLHVNESSQDLNRRNVGERTYTWSDLIPDQKHRITVKLNNDEDLTIQAQLIDNSEGRWCYQRLVLPARSAQEWAAFSSEPIPLKNKERYRAGKCEIFVSIEGR